MAYGVARPPILDVNGEALRVRQRQRENLNDERKS